MQLRPHSLSMSMYSSVSSSPSKVPPEYCQLPTKLAFGVFAAAAAARQGKGERRIHVRNASADFLNVVFMVSSFIERNL